MAEPELSAHLADYVKQPADGGTTGGTVTAYTCSSTPAPTALLNKIGVVITAHLDSGASPTLNWDTLGAKPIVKPNGNAAVLKAGGIYTLRYNATSQNFILQGEGASGNATASDLLSGKTASTDAGDITGTLALTGTAVASDVVSGKTFYNTDPKTQVTGTYSNIKSIQRGSTTVNSTSTTVTIASIDPTRSIIILTPRITSAAGYESRNLISGQITNSTTLTFTVYNAINTPIVDWQVIEFNNVKSLQTGSKATSLTTDTVTITGVNIAKSIVVISYSSSWDSVDLRDSIVSAQLTNSTTITFKQCNAVDKTILWQVIEFN